MDEQTQTIAATASVTGVVAWLWRRILDKPDEQAKEQAKELAALKDAMAAQHTESERRASALELRLARVEVFTGSGERGGLSGRMDEMATTLHKVNNTVQLLAIDMATIKDRASREE